jgi:hypothetical protein
MDVDPIEILDELSRTAPLELERAALRVANRKLLGRIAELEPQESNHEQAQPAQELAGAGAETADTPERVERRNPADPFGAGGYT